MKYWIFQGNQVLGPYEPADLGRHSAFGAESLVCPEGRKGTNIGDWQRAATVPELSAALAAGPAPQEPAALGGLQEKMALMEELVLKLQEGLRDKDAKLAAAQHESGGREAVDRLSETIDKAVAAEKNVEREVAAQGAAIADLTKEIAALRARMNANLAAAAAAPDPALPAFSGPEALTTTAPVAGLAPADVVSEPKSEGRNKALIFGGLFGLAALGSVLFVFGGREKRNPAMPAGLDASPPPAPPAPAPIALPPAPAPPAAVDPRGAAIEAANQWELPDGRKLGQVLELLSPPIGNLSPWMAEPLADSRVSVNYFARGGGAGAPTVAYEFEVDLGAKTVAGRNPAAKAVIAGHAAAPPAPPKTKRVALKSRRKRGARAPKASPDSAPAPPGGKAADEALLDDVIKE